MIVEPLLSGVTLGGLYALIAMGLTLQYGVARIINLSYGEFLIAAAFAAWWLFTTTAVSPLIALFLIVPAAGLINWLVYRFLLSPLVRRSPSREALEAESILSTFGLLFVVQGVMLAAFGGNYFSYSFLSVPVVVFGATISASRLVALGFAVVIGTLLYLGLTRIRTGTAIRAVAVDPTAALLSAIDVPRTAALTYALGGALVAVGGVR